MKYMGSKSRICKYIVPIIQQYIDNSGFNYYYEPFVGGANVIDKIRCDNRYGSDLNPYLIALLSRVRDGGGLYSDVPREQYNKFRAVYNSGDTSSFENWEIGNVGFLASYNGRFFDGGYAKPGYEKAKNGLRYRDYYQEALNNLLKQAENLSGIEFECRDYREFTPHRCVVYCDPPYANTKEYSNSTQFDYEQFWQTMRDWSTDNIVIISEQNAPADFECIWEQNVRRSIKARDKSVSTEKLFVFDKIQRLERREKNNENQS